MVSPSSPQSEKSAVAAGISILNDVLGPVMRGPSSSHTAASYHIGRLVAALLDAPPVSVQVSFDPGGSYGQVYRQQGVDLGFAMGIMGLPLTDPCFFEALEAIASRGVDLVIRRPPSRRSRSSQCGRHPPPGRPWTDARCASTFHRRRRCRNHTPQRLAGVGDRSGLRGARRAARPAGYSRSHRSSPATGTCCPSRFSRSGKAGPLYRQDAGAP